jgi:hypothetical protein
MLEKPGERPAVDGQMMGYEGEDIFLGFDLQELNPQRSLPLEIKGRFKVCGEQGLHLSIAHSARDERRGERIFCPPLFSTL